MNLKLDGRQETILLGELFGKTINDSCVIALEGPLGAGKTTFVKGLAQGLGVKEVVQSPTFTMLNEYHSGRLPLYHLDLYRLSESSESERQALGDQLVLELDEFINRKMVCVVEWSELFKLIKIEGQDISYLDELDHLTIRFAYERPGEISSEACSEHEKSEEDLGREAFFAGCGAVNKRVLDEVVGKFAEQRK
ncbi:MAG: tRNA (adenosine(37)-N6)-threonylcarbamoyltransferase complex ATPase subunit type 1 TsaE [Candidatus Obscuribacterales bacterium]|nr:tRNA (adenosine(37)-N6)-threonylcarbamoyltransferase complex ATPase subunit type 1 TsaE [Candidatus Obscuribacterales bacterium]